VIAVVGAGAIGGLLAAELIAAGHEVTLCARRPLDRHNQAILALLEGLDHSLPGAGA
jgi:ketopantoate reductase